MATCNATTERNRKGALAVSTEVLAPAVGQAAAATVGKLIAAMRGAFTRIAPMGYEDASGFHFGEPNREFQATGRESAAP